VSTPVQPQPIMVTDSSWQVTTIAGSHTWSQRTTAAVSLPSSRRQSL